MNKELVRARADGACAHLLQGPGASWQGWSGPEPAERLPQPEFHAAAVASHLVTPRLDRGSRREGSRGAPRLLTARSSRAVTSRGRLWRSISRMTPQAIHTPPFTSRTGAADVARGGRAQERDRPGDLFGLGHAADRDAGDLDRPARARSGADPGRRGADPARGPGDQDRAAGEVEAARRHAPGAVAGSCCRAAASRARISRSRRRWVARRGRRRGSACRR